MKSRMTAEGGGDGVEGLSKKEKRLMDMDNTGHCWWGGGIRGLNSNGEIYTKN